VDSPGPDYGKYPIPRFADYRSYFVTATGTASLGGRGLANYTNQGFYSAGTNIVAGSKSGYPSPPPDGQGLTDTTLANGTVKDTNNEAVRGALALKVGSVIDALNPAYTVGGVRLSSYGMFDQFLAQGPRQYTLNHYNYDDQMTLLLPRAVAYSAGLLDFFFRGQIEISLPDEGIYSIVDHATLEPPTTDVKPYDGYEGFSKIRVRLVNSTASIITANDLTSVPQTMSNGTVVAVLKFHRNLCYRSALDGEIMRAAQMPICRAPEEEIVVSEPVNNYSIPSAAESLNGIEAPFTFKKALPINAVDVVLQIVYRGQLGTEADAVVVATKNISEPTFFATYNDTDRVLISNRCYDPTTVANTDSLWNQLAVACKPTSGGLRVVSDFCVNVPLNVRLTFGASSSPVVVAMESDGTTDQRVLPRRFTRFAVLGDPAVPIVMTLGFANALQLEAGTSRQIPLTGHRTEQQSVAVLVNNETDSGYHYQVDMSTVVDLYGAHRAVRNWNGQAFVVDGTTGAAGTPCPSTDLDPLQDTERYPTTVTITGWDTRP
jgi:hypothetical protein